MLRDPRWIWTLRNNRLGVTAGAPTEVAVWGVALDSWHPRRGFLCGAVGEQVSRAGRRESRFAGQKESQFAGRWEGRPEGRRGQAPWEHGLTWKGGKRKRWAGWAWLLSREADGGAAAGHAQQVLRGGGRGRSDQGGVGPAMSGCKEAAAGRTQARGQEKTGTEADSVKDKFVWKGVRRRHEGAAESPSRPRCGWAFERATPSARPGEGVVRRSYI